MQRIFVGLAVLCVTGCVTAPTPGGHYGAPIRDAGGQETGPDPARTQSSDSSEVDVEPARSASVGQLVPPARLRLCRPSISNKPQTTSAGEVVGYNRLVVVNGVMPLVTAPAENVCLSSGFGPRRGRPHKGIDLVAKPASIVFSAGPGVVSEVRTARGFGLYVLIDHGQGIFTRYAHLQAVEPDIQPGVVLDYGRPLGLMGATGNATAIHLHYEILTGDIDNPRRSFGLQAHNPLSFPAYQVQTAAF